MTHVLKRAMLPVLGLAIATLAGCATSEPRQPAASVPPPANVTGTWTGGATRGASTMTMVLQQTGTSVTGTLSGAGTMDGPIEGTVQGNTIRLRERSGFGTAPALTVRGNEITGMLGQSEVTFRRSQ